jgi:hypothetical protein
MSQAEQVQIVVRVQMGDDHSLQSAEIEVFQQVAEHPVAAFYKNIISPGLE